LVAFPLFEFVRFHPDPLCCDGKRQARISRAQRKMSGEIFSVGLSAIELKYYTFT